MVFYELRTVFSGVVVASVAYVLWPQVALWRDRVKEPCCARCRYAVRGITALICPECGADLRVEGILTQAMSLRRKRTPIATLVIWTGLWALLGWALTFPLGALPGRITSTKTTTLTPASAADAGLSLRFELESTGWTEPPTHRRFSLGLMWTGRPEASGTASFTWPDRAATESTGSAESILKPGAPASREALRAWLASKPVAAGAGQALADEADAILAELAGQPYDAAMGLANLAAWSPGGMNNAVSVSTPWWVQPAAGAAWLALWPVGALLALWLFHRRSNPKPSQAQAPAQPSPAAT